MIWNELLALLGMRQGFASWPEEPGRLPHLWIFSDALTPAAHAWNFVWMNAYMQVRLQINCLRAIHFSYYISTSNNDGSPDECGVGHLPPQIDGL